MVFQFKDKSSTIKHLGFILQVKSINSETLHITESYDQRTIQQDLLYYKDAKALHKDIKRLFKELQSYNKRVQNLADSLPPGYDMSDLEKEDED